MAIFNGSYAGQANLGEYTTFCADDQMRIDIVPAKVSFEGSSAPDTTGIPIYRGIILGQYVYNIGSPPDGAINIVIVGYTEQS